MMMMITAAAKKKRLTIGDNVFFALVLCAEHRSHRRIVAVVWMSTFSAFQKYVVPINRHKITAVCERNHKFYSTDCHITSC